MTTHVDFNLDKEKSTNVPLSLKIVRLLSRSGNYHTRGKSIDYFVYCSCTESRKKTN